MKTLPRELNYSLFEPLKETSFRLTDLQGNEEGLILSELIVLIDHHAVSKDALKVPFSLIFHIQANKVSIPQGIYTLSHPEAGDHLLFFVPIQPDEKGNRLQVILN